MTSRPLARAHPDEPDDEAADEVADADRGLEERVGGLRVDVVRAAR